MKPKKSAVAYIDGGSRGNPGSAGFGVYFRDTQENTIKEIYGYLGTQTNNYAEYSALIAALKWALKNQFTNLSVYSDSELLVKQIRGLYQVKSPSLKVLYDETKRLIKELDAFNIQHVPRSQNKEADKLANLAMDREASSD
jgi:probable phosphoglycerate mutase